MRLAGLKWCHLANYVYTKTIIVKVDFEGDYFKPITDKMNDYCQEYYINELLSRANSE